MNAMLTALLFAMTVRAFMSWFPELEGSKFHNFLYMLTEPLVSPVRVIFDKYGWFSGLPIDMPFFVSYILLSVVLLILEMFA